MPGTRFLSVYASRRRLIRAKVWEAGVDAYVADPDRLAEICARARALIRRYNTPQPIADGNTTLHFATIRIDPVRQTVIVDNGALQTRPKSSKCSELSSRSRSGAPNRLGRYGTRGG